MPALIIEIGSLFLAILVLLKLNTIPGFQTLATLPVYLVSLRPFIGRFKRFSGEERQKHAIFVEAFRDSLDGLAATRGCDKRPLQPQEPFILPECTGTPITVLSRVTKHC